MYVNILLHPIRIEWTTCIEVDKLCIHLLPWDNRLGRWSGGTWNERFTAHGERRLKHKQRAADKQMRIADRGIYHLLNKKT